VVSPASLPFFPVSLRLSCLCLANLAVRVPLDLRFEASWLNFTNATFLDLRASRSIGIWTHPVILSYSLLLHTIALEFRQFTCANESKICPPVPSAFASLALPSSSLELGTVFTLGFLCDCPVRMLCVNLVPFPGPFAVSHGLFTSFLAPMPVSGRSRS
jgi:hypothetical protein